MTKADTDATATDAAAPTPEQHRSLQDGALRAAIFGISDGLVTNVSLILGVAGADAASGTVRLAGLAGMIAGAFSMAAGEFVSMAAQRELLEREIEVEREALTEHPKRVRDELISIFTKRGISQEMAQEFTEEVTRTPELALETYARAGLGVDPGHLGSPIAAATSSFVSFSIGAIIPLLPWFFLEGDGAVGVSILLGALTALAIGGAIGASTGRSPVVGALRQLALGALAGGMTYLIGALLGVQVS
jgi:VIT1/CCC1 family predicted Fe2+/Mn2+ transporter